MKRSPMPRGKSCPRCRTHVSLCSCGEPSSLTRTPPKRSGRVKPVSDKRRRENRERRKMRERHFGKGQDRPACAIRWDEGCTRFADGLHELLKRSRGGDITDPDNCVPACNYCNQMVEDHPVEAHERGWAQHSWED